MPPFAEAQAQDVPIIMATTGYDEADDSSITDELGFFHKTAKHNGTTDNETSNVVLASYYDVLLDLNLCCHALHDAETVVTGSTRKTSYEYEQVAFSLPSEKGNMSQAAEHKEEVEASKQNKKTPTTRTTRIQKSLSRRRRRGIGIAIQRYKARLEQEEESKEDVVGMEQEKVMSTNNNTLEYEKKPKKCSRVNRIHNKSTSTKKVNSRQSTTTTTHLSSSSNQKEKKSKRTGQIKKTMSLKRTKSIHTTMDKASIPTNKKKKKKKTASVMMTKGTLAFKKMMSMRISVRIIINQ